MAVVAKKIEAKGDTAPQNRDWMHNWHLDSVTDIINSCWHTYFAEVADRAEKLLLDNVEVIVETRVSYNMQNITREATKLDSAPM